MVHFFFILDWPGFSQFLLWTPLTIQRFLAINCDPLLMRGGEGSGERTSGILVCNAHCPLLLPHSTCQELSLTFPYPASHSSPKGTELGEWRTSYVSAFLATHLCVGAQPAEPYMTSLTQSFKTFALPSCSALWNKKMLFQQLAPETLLG